MPKNTTHDRAAELHKLAAHAHAAAAVAHGKGDHLTAHELTKQAHEHSMNARKLSEEIVMKEAKPSKAKKSRLKPGLQPKILTLKLARTSARRHLPRPYSLAVAAGRARALSR